MTKHNNLFMDITGLIGSRQDWLKKMKEEEFQEELYITIFPVDSCGNVIGGIYE